MRRITVQCTLQVVVEMEDHIDAEFMIEENSCPGTGIVGNAVADAIEYGDEHGVCWACNLRGENKIISIEKI